jgi:glutamate formiminotransferase
MKIFECVPNVSEGRDTSTLDACARAIESAGVTLAHRTHDASHHRAVFTFFGTHETVVSAVLALGRVAAERIDLRVHRGAHPRIGALDVVPFVPFADASEADAVALAREAATRVWQELAIPSFFYGAAATAGRLLGDVRRGEFEGLSSRAHSLDTGDFPHARAGAVAIGVRAPLVAFNIVLRGGDVELARAIARAIRERGGGLRTLRALGLKLDDGRAQVSCNITDPEATPLWQVLALVRTLAARAGVAVEESELIGLVPRAALESVVAHAFGVASLPSPAETP